MNNDHYAIAREIRGIPVPQDSVRFPVLTDNGFRNVTVPRVTIEDVARWANNEVEALEGVTDDIQYSAACDHCDRLVLTVDGICPCCGEGSE